MRNVALATFALIAGLTTAQAQALIIETDGSDRTVYRPYVSQGAPVERLVIQAPKAAPAAGTIVIEPDHVTDGVVRQVAPTR